MLTSNRVRILILGIVAAGAILAGQSRAESEPLTLYTENYGNLSYSLRGQSHEHSGEWISGSAVNFVSDLLRLSGVDYRLKLRQWAVGYERALEKPNTAVFSAVRPEPGEARDDLYWIGPIARDDWALYVWRDRPVTIRSVEDLRNLRVGGYRDAPSTEYLMSLGIEVSTLDDDRLNPWRLKHDLIDVWITSNHKAYKLAFEEGHPDIMEALHLNRVDLFLALNPDTPPEVLGRLDQAYRTMIDRGRRWD
jgi:polar amino acid transport system substrate-binding protein